jgi:redox-sensing transcriptional repressor
MSSIPSATVGRLVTYLRILTEFESEGVKSTSSDDLATVAHVSAFQVRKDLAYFGRFGTRGAGYTVATLRRELRRILGLTRPWHVAIMGMGRLGQALADYPNYDRQEFLLEAAFDLDPAIVGRRFGDLTVDAVADVGAGRRRPRHRPGVPDGPGPRRPGGGGCWSAPASAASSASPPRSWSRAEGVRLERVDLSAGLQRLTYYLHGAPMHDRRRSG